MTLWQRYCNGMLSGAGSVLFKTVLNILVIPVMISRLGLDAFGLYLLLIALFEVASLLDMGASNALVTLLSNTSGTTSESASQEHQAYLKAGHALFGVLTGLFLSIGLLLWPQFVPQFHIGAALQHSAELGFLFIVLEASLSIYSCYASSVLLAHCAHQWNNVADTLYFFIANVGALLLLWMGFDLTAVLLARLIGTVCRLLLIVTQARRIETNFFHSTVPFQLSYFKKLLKLGSHAMMLNFSIIISHKIDDIVIAQFLPLSAVGIYEIVFRFLGLTVQICLKLSEGAFPLFSRMAAAKQTQQAGQLFLRMSSLLYMVGALLILLIVCHYVELFRLFSANRIPMAQTWPVLWIAIPCILSGILQMPANAWLFTWGHQRYLTISSLLTALTNLGLSVLFVQVFGLAGVALGTLIPQLIQHQAFLIRKTCKLLGISANRYIRAVHGAIFAPLLVSFLWIQTLKLLCPSVGSTTLTSIIPIGLMSLSAAIIGFSLWFVLTATPLEKELLNTQIVQPLQKKLKPRNATIG